MNCICGTIIKNKQHIAKHLETIKHLTFIKNNNINKKINESNLLINEEKKENNLLINEENNLLINEEKKENKLLINEEKKENKLLINEEKKENKLLINEEKKENKLLINEDQEKFIKSEIQNCSVYGNPGCGKTTSIIQYCIDKHTNNNINSNEFIIITFSKTAQMDFIEKGIKTKVNIFTNKNIRTIHSLAGHIMFKSFGKTSKSLETIVLSCYEHIKNDKINLLEFQLLNSLKFLIIDEAQDINENQYNFACIISEKLNIKLILVGDPNQNIYQFQNGTDKFLLNHSKNIFNLTINYRSTKNIVNLANYLKPHQELNIIKTDNEEGEKPYIYCNSMDNIMKHLIEEIKNTKYKLHEIAIIGSVRKSKFIENGEPISIGLNSIINIFEKNNIKFNKYFKIDNETVSLKKDKQIIENHINLLTVHGSKGLEFKKTFVINYHVTTYSCLPTEEQYEDFKYLWYVALTRAKEKLIIYILKDKRIFNNIPNNLINKNIDYKPFEGLFETIDKTISYSVTKIINDKKYFSENKILEFENKFKYTLENEKLYDIDKVNIIDNDEYATLYGLYIENIFEYVYYNNNDLINEYVDKYLKKINETVLIEKKDKKQFYENFEIVETSYLVYLNGINKKNKKLYEKYFKDVNEKIVPYIIENIGCYINKEYIKNLYNELLNNTNFEKIMFDITLYYYQIENECKFLLKNDFTQHINELNLFVEEINILTKDLNDFEFQKMIKHNNINLLGVLDIVNKNKIIELKFTSSIDIKYIIQVLLYYNLYHQDWINEKDIEIWNLKDGYKYKVVFDNNFNAWDLNCFICDVLDVKMKNNIIMFDLETNIKVERALFSPINEHEIIDRYFYEYNFNSVVSYGFIKPETKLKEFITKLTGITNEDLINADDNYDNIKNDMNKILKYCINPLFIGHNSNNFDLKVLEYNDILNLKDILKADSMIFLRQFNIGCKTNKLIDHYNFIFDTIIEQTHQAKGDTILIVEICKKLNLTSDKLLFLHC